MRNALLVEDDRDQVEEVKRVLTHHRFRVTVADCYTAGLDLLQNHGAEYDLVILDRRLPLDADGDVLNTWGDLLFDQSLVAAPNSRIIVFTGFAEVEQVLHAVTGRAKLSYAGSKLDKISVIRKMDAPAFEDEVGKMANIFRQLDDIDVVFDDIEASDAFIEDCTRRVALEYAALAVEIEVLDGGMSDARVWRARLRGLHGSIANLVIKTSASLSPRGGVADQISVDRVAAVTSRYTEFYEGVVVSVMQGVGEEAQSLGSLIRKEEVVDYNTVTTLLADIASLDFDETVKTFGEVTESILSWERLLKYASDFGITLPSQSMQLRVRWAARHGDLHSENILVDRGHAVLIDFDSSCYGTALLDSMTLLLSTLGHESFSSHSHFWPSAAELEHNFGGSDLVLSPNLQPLYAYVLQARTDTALSTREFWVLTLAYAVRQLKYEDVVSNSEVRERILALARRASLTLT